VQELVVVLCFFCVSLVEFELRGNVKEVGSEDWQRQVMLGSSVGAVEGGEREHNFVSGVGLMHWQGKIASFSFVFHSQVMPDHPRWNHYPSVEA
jgi:hypothetical protein